MCVIVSRTHVAKRHEALALYPVLLCNSVLCFIIITRLYCAEFYFIISLDIRYIRYMYLIVLLYLIVPVHFNVQMQGVT